MKKFEISGQLSQKILLKDQEEFMEQKKKLLIHIGILMFWNRKVQFFEYDTASNYHRTQSKTKLNMVIKITC